MINLIVESEESILFRHWYDLSERLRADKKLLLTYWAYNSPQRLFPSGIIITANSFDSFISDQRILSWAVFATDKFLTESRHLKVNTFLFTQDETKVHKQIIRQVDNIMKYGDIRSMW